MSRALSLNELLSSAPPPPTPRAPLSPFLPFLLSLSSFFGPLVLSPLSPPLPLPFLLFILSLLSISLFMSSSLFCCYLFCSCVPSCTVVISPRISCSHISSVLVYYALPSSLSFALMDLLCSFLLSSHAPCMRLVWFRLVLCSAFSCRVLSSLLDLFCSALLSRASPCPPLDSHARTQF